MFSIKVRSTAIRQVDYDAGSQALTVRFLKGGLAVYEGVPRAVFDAMIKAPSVGRYYRQVIQARYGRRSQT